MKKLLGTTVECSSVVSKSREAKRVVFVLQRSSCSTHEDGTRGYTHAQPLLVVLAAPIREQVASINSLSCVVGRGDAIAATHT